MPDTIGQWRIPGTKLGSYYMVSRYADGTWECSCPAWVYKAKPKVDCRHILHQKSALLNADQTMSRERLAQMLQYIGMSMSQFNNMDPVEQRELVAMYNNSRVVEIPMESEDDENIRRYRNYSRGLPQDEQRERRAELARIREAARSAALRHQEREAEERTSRIRMIAEEAVSVHQELLRYYNINEEILGLVTPMEIVTLITEMRAGTQRYFNSFFPELHGRLVRQRERQLGTIQGIPRRIRFEEISYLTSRHDIPQPEKPEKPEKPKFQRRIKPLKKK